MARHKHICCLSIACCLSAFGEDVERIYKKESGLWLKTEAEYGCAVEDKKDFVSFGFDSAFLPGIMMVYWQHRPGLRLNCDEFTCPPDYYPLWKKSFYKSDFTEQTVKFNGMSLELKWKQPGEVFLGDIKFLEKIASTLRVTQHGRDQEIKLSCILDRAPATSDSPGTQVSTIVSAWEEELCSPQKKRKKDKYSGPIQIGQGGLPNIESGKSAGAH